MRLKRRHGLVLIATVASGWWLLGDEDTADAARLKCQQHLRDMAGHELSDEEVAFMKVSGDAQNGRVQGAVLRDNQVHYVVCQFENGAAKRAELNQSSWPETDHATIARARAPSI
ncbi:hypothetical protein [Ancylobacter sp. IITR112]|uniref:hypothetical protein n=1 Tax=Ancylobacter sp. IITR112 TaxID=3138073 RepID=UPI00352AD9BE